MSGHLRTTTKSPHRILDASWKKDGTAGVRNLFNMAHKQLSFIPVGEKRTVIVHQADKITGSYKDPALPVGKVVIKSYL